MTVQPVFIEPSALQTADQAAVPERLRRGERTRLVSAFRALGHGADPHIAHLRSRNWLLRTRDFAYIDASPVRSLTGSQSASTGKVRAVNSKTVLTWPRLGERVRLAAAFRAQGHGADPQTGYERSKHWLLGEQ